MKLTALPAEGRRGRAPAFPLPPRQVVWWDTSDGQKIQLVDKTETARVRKRELDMWRWAWSTPQACAWAMPSEAWRLYTIAMWVRTYVLCETSQATAADKGSLHRFADQIGMTPAGLKENGWTIATDEVAAKATDSTAGVDGPRAASRPRRLRAVPDAQ